MINFNYAKVSTTKAAIEAIKKPGAGFIAGGTNLVDLMKKGVLSPDKLVDITGLPLRSIEQKNGVIRIGALALNSEVANDNLVKMKLPLLSLAIRAGASPQIRNMATMGGNLLQRTRCSYFYDTTLPCNKRQPGSGCSALEGYNRMHAIFTDSNKCIAVHPSDMAVAFTALEGSVIVNGPKGERKILYHNFFRFPGANPEKDTELGKGELITALEFPDRPQFAQYYHYEKIRDRASYAFALVSVAASLDLDDKNVVRSARIAIGGVAHKPYRPFIAENSLKGHEAGTERFENAVALAMSGAKGFGYNNFKLKLVPRVMLHTLQTILSNKKDGKTTVLL
jgi:xanthine dehydrogenase YagS FAD-binding subunit